LDQELLQVIEAHAMQVEYLLPWQLRKRVSQRPVAYIPLGTIEWHCEHLPVGLDALTAHGICTRAALRDGGIVFPPLYYGTGGDHGHYPFTIMMDDDLEIATLIGKTLKRLRDFGIKLAVLFSGHFADSQLAMIDRIAKVWNEKDNGMKVYATAVNRIEGPALSPDHAGVFETTLLSGLWPELVQVDRLPSLKDAPLPAGDIWDTGRHDPKHLLWGVIGPDPRNFDPNAGPTLLEASVAWLVDQVRQKLTAP
jgi:creatinine amidohydrolase